MHPKDVFSPFGEYTAAVESIVRDFASTAVERDRRGGTATRERDLLRQSGLLKLAVPSAYGGEGAPWPLVYKIVRRIAEADSSLAHLFAFQHLQVASVWLFGDEQQKSHYLGATAAESWFWGNAVNPLDKRLKSRKSGGGLVLDGEKSFCSGALGSNILLVSFWPESSETAQIAAIPSARAGITIRDDWDNIGQRQTDSGSVVFAGVEISESEVLRNPGPGSSPYATLRTCVAQLILANLYLGIGQGAFEEGRKQTREITRPWPGSGAASANQDPYMLQRFGELRLALRAAAALAEEAAALLEAAWQRGLSLTAEERGAVAIAVSEARLLSARAGLDTASQIFAAAGSRSTRASLGLDRFWRNVRVHSLHDPLDYKLREVGNLALNGVWPEPSLYS